MTKKEPVKKKHAGGRPTKYKPEYCQLAYRHCLLGATNEDLANLFEVTVSTISKWLVEIDEFSEALRAGRDNADAAVADSLYQQAISGNTTAQIFWLKNRRRMSWRDKQEVDHTTNGKDIDGIRITFVEPGE